MLREIALLDHVLKANDIILQKIQTYRVGTVIYSDHFEYSISGNDDL